MDNIQVSLDCIHLSAAEVRPLEIVPNGAPIFSRSFTTFLTSLNGGTCIKTFILATAVLILTSYTVLFDELNQQVGDAIQVEQLPGGLDHTCGTFWTPHISSGQSSFDGTSTNSVSPGCNLITICLTSGNGGNGTAQASFYEVTSGGSQIFKTAGTIAGPWTGCYQPSISFSVGDNSKVRLVVNNQGLDQVYQMNAG